MQDEKITHKSGAAVNIPLNTSKEHELLLICMALQAIYRHEYQRRMEERIPWPNEAVQEKGYSIVGTDMLPGLEEKYPELAQAWKDGIAANSRFNNALNAITQAKEISSE